MGCNSSKPTYDAEYFYSRSDTPSIYSRNTRPTPSHSRNNSGDSSATRPLRYPATTPNVPSNKFFNRFTTSGRYPRGINEKPCSLCGNPRRPDEPCFACLREKPKPKPKPRRYRSRRNAQVLIPRVSIYGAEKKKRRRSRSNSMEAPLAVEDLPPWVTARHGVFVPKRVANELNNSITRHEFDGRRENRDRSRDRYHSESSGSASDLEGGFIVAPEVYYANLPLPDLPPEAYAQQYRSQMSERRRVPAWI